MKRHSPHFLAIHTAVTWTLGLCAAQAGGIPVFDAGNLAQNAKAAMEAVLQTAKQVEQYELQVQQYRNMVQNTDTLTAQDWDQAQRTMGRLRAAMGTLEQYRQQADSLEKHLRQFKDVEGYLSSRCFNGRCDAAQWSQMTQEQGRLGAKTQKSANDALLRSLGQQQQAITTDAVQLEKLQTNAKGAQGQMQALGAANQLASHVAYQLQQIRALLVAQNTALAARQRTVADREALAQARQEAALAPRMGKTPNPLNWLSIKP